MNRDPRLRGLSSDHHHALVLARRIANTPAPDMALVAQVAERYTVELAPHFAIEESLLLPALTAAGEHGLVTRTLADHQALRSLLAAAEAGDPARLTELAARLTEHVRFEERELFPVCERLPDAVLMEVERAGRTA